MDGRTKDAIKALLERRQRANTVSADSAKKWLMDEGLLDGDGELKPQYGGQGEDKVKD